MGGFPPQNMSLWHINYLKLVIFLFKKLILIGGNYFTIWLWFLPYINMNQSQVHMCLPILNPSPTSIPTPSLWVVPEHWLWVPCYIHWTCTGHLFHIWYYICFSDILSDHPILTFSHRVQKSVLYICVSFAFLDIG